MASLICQQLGEKIRAPSLPIWDKSMLLPEASPALSSSKRFVIERALGQGGMGVVYQALDLERQTRVALKASTQRDAVTIYRLKNEFRQLADLSHPNLVTLHELVNEGTAWFFTMELVNGSPFDEYCNPIRASDAPPEAEPERRATASLRFLRDVSVTLNQRKIGSELPLRRSTCHMRRLRNALRQLVEAVAALHEAGKLHRDLKPSNVLVTPEGRVVVLDFGLVSNGTFIDAAAQDADHTVGGAMFGTPAYMSPEQAAGESVTTASDWYSVGTMLYEAITGELPFDGAIVEILRRKDEFEPPPPSELVTGVPDDLDFLCR
jgi:serine/threonine protein kinase